MLGVAVASVSNWIDQGKLKAGRTPGGHRRVEAEDLVEFLRRQGLRIPDELLPSPPKVLIVDDEPGVTTLLSDEIASAFPDFEVSTAHDGFSAGEAVGATHPDVVILDMRMPGMDGLEVCRRVKERKDTRDTVIIGITADPSDELQEAILSRGARCLMHKPLNIDALLDEIADALHDAGRTVRRDTNSVSR